MGGGQDGDWMMEADDICVMGKARDRLLVKWWMGVGG